MSGGADHSREMPVQDNIKSVDMIFLKCRHWNTEACPHRSTIPMRLSLLNPAPRIMLAEKTNRQLFRICSSCPNRKIDA